MKRPRSEGDVDTACVTEELDGHGEGADPSERYAEADAIAFARALRLKRGRAEEERQGERAEGSQGHLGWWEYGLRAVRTGHAAGWVSRSIGRRPRRVHGGRARSCVAIGFAVVVGFAGCAPPDAPAVLALELPTEALNWLEPDTVASEVLHPGVVYRYLWSPRGPWAVHLVQAALSERCDLEFGVLQAEAREGGGSGRERVSSMVARSGDRVLAAVNADFFTPTGTTVGAEVVNGRVRAAEPRPTFAWRPGRAPWMGIAEITADEVRVGWSVDREDGDDGTEAVGGFPDLIDEGVRVGDLEVSARPSFAAARHPRTAVGYDPAVGTVWLVVVDGRQAPYSAGMTLPELAELFEALGADEAINLDGGGSTALVLGPASSGRTNAVSRPAAGSRAAAGYRPTAVNRPSDITGERPVVNGLALIQHARGCARPDP